MTLTSRQYLDTIANGYVHFNMPLDALKDAVIYAREHLGEVRFTEQDMGECINEQLDGQMGMDWY